MMTSICKSCRVAFSIARNHATSDIENATMGATTLQRTGLKALACKVLQRNQGSNSPATSQKSDCNFSAEIDQPAATTAADEIFLKLCKGYPNIIW